MKKYLKKEWKLVLITIVLCALVMLSKGGASVIQMNMFDYVLQGNLSKVFLFLGINAVNWYIFSLLSYLEQYTEKKVIAKMNCALRDDLSNQIMQKNFNEFRRKDTGEYLSWYINDVKQAEQLGFATFFELCMNVMSLMVGVLLLLSYHWLLLVVSVFSAIVIILFSKKMDNELERSAEEVSISLEYFSEKVKEQISGFLVLKSFGLLRKFEKNVKENSESLEEKKRTFEMKKAQGDLRLAGVNTSIGAVNNGVLFFLAIIGVIPLHTIYGGGNLISMVSQSTSVLGQLRLNLVSAKPYFNKITETKEKIETKKILTEINKGIFLKNISFSYNKKLILKNANFAFYKNKKYALIGSSGSGKTTLFRLILGYLQHYDGEVIFDDDNLKDIQVDSIQNEIAYIEQEVFLFNDTIRENIILGKEYDEIQMMRVLVESALIEDIDKFENGIETVVGENGNRISGGQRQRIAIARALYHNRSILLVDEGTSALDKENALIVENCLLKNSNLTLILISHNLSKQQKEKFDKVYELS